MDLVTQFITYGERLAEAGFFDAFESRNYDGDRVEAKIESGNKRIVVDLPLYGKGEILVSCRENEKRRAFVLSGVGADMLMDIVAKNISCAEKEIPDAILSGFAVAKLPKKALNCSIYPVGLCVDGPVFADHNGHVFIVQDEVMPTMKLYKELFDMGKDWKIINTMPRLYQSLRMPILLKETPFITSSAFEGIPRASESTVVASTPLQSSAIPKGLTILVVGAEKKIFSAKAVSDRAKELRQVYQATVPGYSVAEVDPDFQVLLISAVQPDAENFDVTLDFRQVLTDEAVGAYVCQARLDEEGFLRMLRSNGITGEIISDVPKIKVMLAQAATLGFKELVPVDMESVPFAGLVKSCVTAKATGVRGSELTFSMIASGKTSEVLGTDLYKTLKLPKELRDFGEYAVVQL
jgi:hypothetical protein